MPNNQSTASGIFLIETNNDFGPIIGQNLEDPSHTQKF